MKKYVINTYTGVANALEACCAAAKYAESIGAEMVGSESAIDNSKPHTVEYVDGMDLWIRG